MNANRLTIGAALLTAVAGVACGSESGGPLGGAGDVTGGASRRT